MVGEEWLEFEWPPPLVELVTDSRRLPEALFGLMDILLGVFPVPDGLGEAPATTVAPKGIPAEESRWEEWDSSLLTKGAEGRLS